jgi:hypothetical protein
MRSESEGYDIQVQTYGLEGLNFRCLLEIIESVLHVVDSHATVDAVKADVGNLRHTLVCTILCLEVADIWSVESEPCSEVVLRNVQYGSPVILGAISHDLRRLSSERSSY